VWVVEPLLGVRRGMPRAAHASHALQPEAVPCAELAPPQGAGQPLGPHTPTDPDPLTSDCMFEAELAYDADYQYYLRQGGTVAGTLANIEGHTAAVNEFYARDVQIQHRVTAVVVRTSQFYFHNDGGHLLDLFRAEWNSTQWSVPRDMAHLLTDKSNLSGYAGLAYVGVVCNKAWAYGWSVDSTGVVGHELGHNWGSGHCHDTSPCNNMCGACLYVGPNTRDIKHAFRGALNCLDQVGPYADPVPPYTYPDSVVVTKNQLAAGTLSLDVTENDDDGNCTPFQITAVDDPTPAGAHTSVDALLNLAYDAPQPHVGADVFTYTVTDTDGTSAAGQVVVDVPSRELEAAWPLDEGAGLEAADATGYGHTGELQGGPVWGSGGPFDGGLVFDGLDDQVRLPALGLRGDEVTIGAWLRRDAAQSSWTGILMTRAGTSGGLHFGTADELRYTWTDDSGTWSWNSGLVPPLGQWVYVALVVRPGKAVMHMLEGATHHKKVRQHDHGLVRFDGSSYLGADPDDAGRHFKGALRGVAVFDRAMGESDLWDLAALGGKAEAPRPRDGGARADGPLTWHPAPGATSYDVYLGTDYLSVRDASSQSPEFQGSITGSSWDPGSLAPGQRWFWRVDSDVFPFQLKGAVWQFEVVQSHRWALDETSGGLALDDSGLAHGVFEGGVILGEPGATPNTGTSIRLDGVDDVVRIPPLGLNDDICTIAAWVRRDGDQTAGLIFSNDGTTTAGLSMDFAHQVKATWNYHGALNSWDTGLIIPDNAWTFVAMVVDVDRVAVYKGDAFGNLSSATRVVGGGVGNEAFDGDLMFGEYTLGVPLRFTGWIDDVRFVPAALLPAQVEGLYEGSL